jgi:hypothetical protein
LSALWPRRLRLLARRVPEPVVRALAADPRVARPAVARVAPPVVEPVDPPVVARDAARRVAPRVRVLGPAGHVVPMVVETAGTIVVGRVRRVVRSGRAGRHALASVTIAVRVAPVHAAVAVAARAGREGTAVLTAAPTAGPAATDVPMIVVVRRPSVGRATKPNGAPLQ